MIATALAPAASAGTSRETWTIQLRNGGLVRTAHFSESEQISASRFRDFLKEGYWSIGLLAASRAESRALCRPHPLCGDLPPGRDVGAGLFNNLVTISRAHGAGRHTFILEGTMKISGRGAISIASADIFTCPQNCTSPGYLNTPPTPIAVAPGDEVDFTLVISLTR